MYVTKIPSNIQPILLRDKCVFIGLLAFFLRAPSWRYSVLCMWRVMLYAYCVSCTRVHSADADPEATNLGNAGQDHLVTTKCYTGVECEFPLKIIPGPRCCLVSKTHKRNGLKSEWSGVTVTLALTSHFCSTSHNIQRPHQ